MIGAAQLNQSELLCEKQQDFKSMIQNARLMKKKRNSNRHENPNFWSSALTLQGSITPKVFKNVLFCMMYSFVVSLICHHFSSLKLPISPFEYAGVVMGLSLVFRINSGYDRWWEARKIWGGVVNSARNLSMLVKSYGADMKELKVDDTLRLITMLPVVMKNHLRSIPGTEEMKPYLSHQDYEEMQKWSHKPNFIGLRIAENLSFMYDNKKINKFAFLQAEHLRESLIDHQGACERILKTPMPLVMAIKIRRFIFLFLLILPFALADSIFIDLMVTGLVAYALLSLDQIGIELQNPFALENLSHLPLNDICKTINQDIVEIINRPSLNNK